MRSWIEVCARIVPGLAALMLAGSAWATEGALGRPVAGTSVLPNAGVVPPAPLWVANLGQMYLDGSLGASREVPIANQVSLGLEAEVSFTLATLVKVWDTGPGRWNYSSSLTVPYLWERATATLGAGGLERQAQQSTSNVFDLYVTPLTAGYHFSDTEHVALSLNIWAPTGRYDPDALVNASLNTWTFIPQVAYTKMWPDQGWRFDTTAAIQFYTRNTATDYQNAPLFTLDVMGTKLFGNGWSAGLVVGTVLQMGRDSGTLADKLDGFVGSDLAVGPIVSFDTKVGGRPLSLSLRWVPTVASRNRPDSTRTFLGNVSLVF